MVGFGILVIVSLKICWIQAFGPSLGLLANSRHVSHGSTLNADLNTKMGEEEGDSMTRRNAVFSLIATGTAAFPIQANARISSKVESKAKTTEAAAAAASTASSSSVVTSSSGPGFLPLTVLSAATVFAAKSVWKSEESTSSLFVEQVPYGMREGRNFWNGIDLSAASISGGSEKKGRKLILTSVSEVKPPSSANPEVTKKANPASNSTSAYFMSAPRSESPDSKEEKSAKRPKMNVVRSAPPSNSNLKTLLAVPNTANVEIIPKQAAATKAATSERGKQVETKTAVATKTVTDDVTDLSSQETLSEEERMVLEAQKEAEEAELLLREAEAEAARVDKKLAEMGLSTSSLLPLVKDEVNSELETSSQRDIEVDTKVLTSENNSTSGEPVVSKDTTVKKVDATKSTQVPSVSSVTIPSKSSTVSPEKISKATVPLAAKMASDVENVEGDIEPKAEVAPVQAQAPPVPFSQLVGYVPPVSRVTATSGSTAADSRPIARTTNLRELLERNAK